MKKITTGLFLFIVLFAQVNAQTLEQKLDDLVKAYAGTNKFNGTVLVAHKGSVLLKKGYGYRNAETKVMHDAADIFQIGSVTKQITAAVIMQLQEQGKLSVADKLSKYYPDYPTGDRITIENLLTHTSGIYNYTNDTVLIKGDVTQHYSEEKMIATFKNRPLDFEPGTAWNYSNSAYSLLGYIIGKAAGKPYETVVRERILRPLDMTSSGFDFTHLKEDKKSTGYYSLASTAIKTAPIVDSTIAYAAGALYSTVEDLYKWERAIKTNKILKEASWTRVFTPYKNKYGYGWSIDTSFGKLVTSHGGGIHGFASYLMRFPTEDVVVILLDNGSAGPLSQIAKNLAAIVLNQPYEVPQGSKEIKLDAAIVQQYLGEYEFAPQFIIKVFMDGSQLKGQATNQPAFDLFAEKENLFFLKVVDAKLQFLKDGSGKVTGAVLYQNGQQPRGVKIK